MMFKYNSIKMKIQYSFFEWFIFMFARGYSFCHVFITRSYVSKHICKKCRIKFLWNCNFLFIRSHTHDNGLSNKNFVHRCLDDSCVTHDV